MGNHGRNGIYGTNALGFLWIGSVYSVYSVVLRIRWMSDGIRRFPVTLWAMGKKRGTRGGNRGLKKDEKNVIFVLQVFLKF